MANESRVRADGVAGALSAGLATTDTTMSSAGLADLPGIDSTQHAALTLFATDTDGRVTQREVVYVTAHTAGATTATIARAEEYSDAQTWSAGDKWVHGPTAEDVRIGSVFVPEPAPDFSTLAGWVSSGGSWSTNGTQLAVTSLSAGQVGRIVCTTPVFTPALCVIEGEILLPSSGFVNVGAGSSVGIVLTYSDASAGGFAWRLDSNNTCRFERDGQATIGSVAVSQTANTWYRLRMLISGDAAEGYINGGHYLSARGFGTSGQIGWCGFRAEGMAFPGFRNLRMWSMDCLPA